MSIQIVTYFRYFENLAIQTIAKIYENKKEDAHRNLLARIPFQLGRAITPLSIANDAQCMKFMGHVSCQTLLHVVWNGHTNSDTSTWRYILAAALPFVAPCILTVNLDHVDSSTTGM